MKKIVLLTPYFILLTLCSNAQTKEDSIKFFNGLTIAEYPEAPVNDTAKIFPFVEQMPQYAGGDEALMKFIASNVHYPDSAKDNNILGSVLLGFVVEADASTSNHKIVRSTHPLFDEEALRVVRLLKFEKPGMQQGKAVRVQYNLPIKFRLQ